MMLLLSSYRFFTSPHLFVFFFSVLHITHKIDFRFTYKDREGTEGRPTVVGKLIIYASYVQRNNNM